RPTEEAAHERGDGEEDSDDREDTDRELAIFKRPAWVAVDVGQRRKRDEYTARDQHTCDGWREVVEDLLQAQEVPRRLGRVWREVWIRVLAQRGVDDDAD